jgi:PAS domain S-box-containing protein
VEIISKILTVFSKKEPSSVSYENLLLEASDAIYVTDYKGVITFANKSAHSLFYYEYPEMIGKSIDILTSKSGKTIPFAQIYPGTADAILQHNFIRKDGTEFKGELTAKVFSEGGHQAIIRDVSNAVVVRDSLQYNESRLRALIENSFDIVILLDRNFNIKYISPSVEDSLGYTPQELYDKVVSYFIEIHDRKLIFDLLKSSGITYHVKDIRLKHKDKSLKHFEINAINLLHNETIRGIIVNCHDVHERVMFEKQLMNTNYELDSFVYKVSHDLKAPLKSILGLLQLSAKEESVETLRIYNEMMKRSVEGLDKFIHDLTHFSRNSRIEIAKEIIHFEELLKIVLFQIQYLDTEHRVQIKTEVVQNLEFSSDSQRITTILSNLLSNAYKYHRFENNNPYIHIQITVEQDQAIILVSDNGSGIDPEYQTKVFDMFYRASEQSTGSGLGLYIVKSAVEKLGGNIQLDSNLNVGTIVKITIPNNKN